ncbi:MAG: hypothetical protein K5846_01160 [Bacteroidales bacterium]|nr:hypothetical protein [Bacteroidales bacterium]
MKKLHIIILLISALLICGTSVTAQNNDKQKMTREQLAEAQARHIAQDASLVFNDAVTKQFIQTYCAYQKEIWALGPRIPEVTDSMTDEEVDRILKSRFERSEKILAIREKYYKKYSEFLTPKQVQRVFELDRTMVRRLAKARKETGGKQ